MMLIGLAMAFFLSHKRVWAQVSAEKGRTKLLVAGISNKNKVGFEKDFTTLVAKLKQNETLQLNEE
jgi:cytochrome c biogenesis protein